MDAPNRAVSISVNQKTVKRITNFNILENHSDEVLSSMEFIGSWPENMKQTFLKDMIVIENFISPDDEKTLLEEIEPYLKVRKDLL